MIREKAARAESFLLFIMLLLAGCGSVGRTEERTESVNHTEERTNRKDSTQDMPKSGNTQEKTEEYQMIVDDYARITLRKDGDSARYEQALEQVGIYLKKLNRRTLQQARSEVQSAVQELEQASAEIIPYRQTDEFTDLLAKYGISYVEYAANADERSDDLYDYIRVLKSLDEYLSYEETDDLTRGELQFCYEMSLKAQKIMKSYSYYGINYWFAEWEEESYAYIKQEVLDRLTSFSAEDAVWEHSRKAVEQQMERCLNEYEDLNAEWADHIGKYRERVYQQQQTAPQR